MFNDLKQLLAARPTGRPGTTARALAVLAATCAAGTGLWAAAPGLTPSAQPAPVTAPPATNAPRPAATEPVTSSPGNLAARVPREFANLAFGPIDKPAYPGNPRREVRGVYASLNALRSSRFQTVLSLLRQT